MTNVVPHSFKSELLSGTHNFANGGDSFKLALYTAGSGSPYAPTATVYDSSVSNEVSTSAPNAGYTTGGVALASQAVATGTGTATVGRRISRDRGRGTTDRTRDRSRGREESIS